MHVAIEPPFCGPLITLDISLLIMVYAFIFSPKYLVKLRLIRYPIKPLIVELANREVIISHHMVEFKIGSNIKSTFFKIFPIDLYGGILGMT